MTPQLLPIPDFFKPTRADKAWRVSYETRARQAAATRHGSHGSRRTSMRGRTTFLTALLVVAAGISLAKSADESTRIRKILEQHFKDMQDFEFTIEDGTLFMLQTRNGKRTAPAAIKIAVDMVAEGLIDKLDPTELAGLQDVERDDHGHVRFAEVDLARKVKAEVQGRLSQRGLRVTVTDKNLGYELRCADPISFDAEYCRDLGFSAVRFLIGGGSGAMVTIQGGRLVAIPFDELREPETGKTKIRLVDVNSEAFRVARAYMIRLEADDFAHAEWVDRLAAAAQLTPGDFRQRFEYLGSITP